MNILLYHFIILYMVQKSISVIHYNKKYQISLIYIILYFNIFISVSSSLSSIIS